MRRARLTGLLVKIEAEEGVDAVPVVGTDGIQLDEHLWGNLETDFLERNLRDNAAGNRMGRHGGAQPAAPWGKITATVALKGAGAAYSALVRPEVEALLRICGLAPTLDATADAEKLTFAPIDEDHESATIYAYAAGSLFKLVGCRGMVTISMNPAQIAMARFEVWGVQPNLPTDVALPAITYPRRAIKPPVVKDQALSLGGYGARYRSFNWEQGSQVVARPRGGAPEGHAGYGITDYDPQFTAQIDSPLKSAFDPWDLEREATEFAWSIQLGQLQYNRMKIAGPAGQILRIPQPEDQGYAMIDLRVRCLHAAVDPAFTIVFD